MRNPPSACMSTWKQPTEWSLPPPVKNPPSYPYLSIWGIHHVLQTTALEQAASTSTMVEGAQGFPQLTCILLYKDSYHIIHYESVFYSFPEQCLLIKSLMLLIVIGEAFLGLCDCNNWWLQKVPGTSTWWTCRVPVYGKAHSGTTTWWPCRVPLLVELMVIHLYGDHFWAS